MSNTCPVPGTLAHIMKKTYYTTRSAKHVCIHECQKCLRLFLVEMLEDDIFFESYSSSCPGVIRPEVQTILFCHMSRLTHWVVIVLVNIPAFSLLRLPVICVCEISISFKDLCFPVRPLWISMHQKWPGISNLTRASDKETIPLSFTAETRGGLMPKTYNEYCWHICVQAIYLFMVIIYANTHRLRWK